jgi:hypothetical protein
MKDLKQIIEQNTTKKDCDYYHWNSNPKYSSYPRSMGARCEYYDQFFYRTEDNILEPNCYSCEKYEPRGNVNERR